MDNFIGYQPPNVNNALSPTAQSSAQKSLGGTFSPTRKKGANAQSKIKVAVRVRPLLQHEAKSGH